MTSERFQQLSTPGALEPLFQRFIDETQTFFGYANPAEQLRAAIAWGYERGREKHVGNTGGSDAE